VMTGPRASILATLLTATATLPGCGPTPEKKADATPTPPASATPTDPTAPPTRPAEVVPPPSEPVDAAKPTAACPPALPEGATIAERLDAAKAACGGVLLVTRADGLHALTPALEPIVRVVDKGTRWVQTRSDGEARELYYFAADDPDFVRLDLRTGQEETLARLPHLSNACFTGAEPGEKAPPADPVMFLQSARDLDLDLAAGVLCLDLGDRNENMASIRVNLRVDLKTRKVEQRTTLVSDECKKGAGRERERACEPARKDLPEATEVAGLGQYAVVSPSGRWAYYTDELFEQSGDYIYYAAFVYDTEAKTAHAITPEGLVKIDLAARDPAKGPPEGTCYIPGEAEARWMPGSDRLILDGCGAAGWLLVEPPGRVQKIEGYGAVAWP
ncbi:MAG: hypothetical protein R3B09_31530, partial [Nannocystaceae bacterium]